MLPIVYERQHALLPIRQMMPQGIGAVTEAQALAAVRQSDFVIMAVESGLTPTIYPFDDSMEALRPRLLAECEQSLIPLGRFRIFGNDVILYGRPPAGSPGAQADP